MNSTCCRWCRCVIRDRSKRVVCRLYRAHLRRCHKFKEAFRIARAVRVFNAAPTAAPPAAKEQ